MSEPSEAPSKPEEVPQRLCEKCRHEYPLDSFYLDREDLEYVCKRCLRVMGYAVKAG